MPNPIHPPLDKIKINFQSKNFKPELVQQRLVQVLVPNTFRVFDIRGQSTLREYIIPSTMLPPEVAILAAMRAGLLDLATEWPLLPMEDFQLT